MNGLNISVASPYVNKDVRESTRWSQLRLPEILVRFNLSKIVTGTSESVMVPCSHAGSPPLVPQFQIHLHPSNLKNARTTCDSKTGQVEIVWLEDAASVHGFLGWKEAHLLQSRAFWCNKCKRFSCWLASDLLIRPPLFKVKSWRTTSFCIHIVYSWDWYATKYAATMGIQHPRQEIIENLKIYLKRAIASFVRENGVPSCIFCFRDGGEVWPLTGPTGAINELWASANETQSAKCVHYCCLVWPWSWKRKASAEAILVKQLMPHFPFKRGINLWAAFFPSLTPVRSLMVTGILPNA